MTTPKLAPSILSADFAQLGAQVRAAITAGAQCIHVDVMDGHFVPNLTIGPLVVKALKPIALELGVPLDVHLMVEKPEQLLPAFAAAGADWLTVHYETCPHLHRTIQQLRELNCKAGVAINPATAIFNLAPILPMLDLVLVMSVNPGFGGQAYIPESTGRLRLLRQMLNELQSPAELSVDGGVKASNIAAIAAAGASVLVAGSAIFEGNIAANVAQLQAALA